MPELSLNDEKVSDALAMLMVHLFERLDVLNRTLSNIDESLQAISSRLSYAAVLDNQD